MRIPLSALLGPEEPWCDDGPTEHELRRDAEMAEIDASYQRYLDDMLEAEERRSREELEAAVDKAVMAEIWLSMPCHDDPGPVRQRFVEPIEWVNNGTRYATITVRWYIKRPVRHSWAEWHFLLVVNGR